MHDEYVIQVQYKLSKERNVKYPCKVVLTVIESPMGFTDKVIPGVGKLDYTSSRSTACHNWVTANTWITHMRRHIEKRIKDLHDAHTEQIEKHRPADYYMMF